MRLQPALWVHELIYNKYPDITTNVKHSNLSRHVLLENQKFCINGDTLTPFLKNEF